MFSGLSNPNSLLYGSGGQKSKMWPRDCIPSGDSRGESFFLPLLIYRGYSHSLACGPFLPLRSQQQSIFLSLPSVPSPLDSDPVTSLLRGLSWFHRACPDNPGSSHLQTLPSSEATYSQMPGVRMWAWGRGQYQPASLIFLTCSKSDLDPTLLRLLKFHFPGPSFHFLVRRWM